MAEIIVNFQPGTQQTTVRAMQQPTLAVHEVPALPNGHSVITGPPGPAGPPGAPGPPGVRGGQFEFTQSVASAVWTVNHNLGFRPNVSVLSPGGVEVWAEVIHANVNQVFIYFDQAQTGLVLCS